MCICSISEAVALLRRDRQLLLNLSVVYLSFVPVRMRSRGSCRCFSTLVSWPSSWVSFHFCLIKRLSGRPERFRSLLWLCAARWGKIINILDVIQARCLSKLNQRNHPSEKEMFIFWTKLWSSSLTPHFFALLLPCPWLVQSVPVLDVCSVLSNSIKKRRTILTVPWLVEFLSMLDYISPLLLCYRTALGTLLLLYRSALLSLNIFEDDLSGTLTFWPWCFW